jgi:hypothetical protein
MAAVLGEALRSIHPVIAVTIVVVVVVAPSVAVAWSAMRLHHPGDRSNDNVVTAGARLLGVFFAILVGFLLVSTFQSFSDARSAAQRERAALDTFIVEARDFEVLSARSVSELGRLAIEYLEVVRTEELEQQGDRGFSLRRADEIVDEIFATLTREAAVAGPREDSRIEQLLRNLDLFEEERVQRLLSAETSIPSVLWAVVIVSALLLMTTMALFPPGSSSALKLYQTTSTAVVVAFTLIALVELEDPYDGAVRVSEDIYRPFAAERAATDGD